ncbi:thiol-disulfide oxidoreductase DCC family protein [Mycobacterium sp. EPa45]|uniref:thiol-disulfide oxidoreductase DCC family protein n=1 Tax=Mycobacterium sp. EPa45 TaxID=1545728 RepID=UPI000641B1EF|nr:DCC1-like thiol-disulfide oxidoreductase family protein [Mycobacterium sp. EPa45]AKK30572.1 thiol-disulfide oxidoreductase [Mycobacterium sp. EPa45]
MTPTHNPPSAPVLLYDGVCGVCNSAVRTILRYDDHGTLRFAALDSDFARETISRHPEIAGLDTAVFVRDPGQPSERVYLRSAALLRIAEYLGGWWRLALAAYVIPAAARDWLYGRFAAVRYRVGGRYDTCPIPPADVRTRFLDTTYG